ncbi:Gfo/Idh/MocA family oxidoreductase [Paenibacillus thiaminolyticus]|uniref:Gfo/Idh/MocA family oxidoreductase n=1 Tax=Paenibacillus thiaminolyticus TaxID=49283 RepID=A0AAP9DR66_PANTH|nr:Gfo/Idh/MocA family oxidoreductase [Paenibacillus thiaminolyticus]MCY9537999.1 Gfo/Idh/MocA family oxidoreductase [Paenibacillus thiaminolyticus]MCY9604935.1 Gfo/Idh/MocA family oxidoreductase [Paenibacillus thiaminolyticus]MCY9610670.1 Gfo/Idh/MocA family oxidoreductase [Paenibacillus thiaminolyticus]MCY9615999.1 Gfo/Idh/MocA family oxidoreductase [Paenibacillus thiaminolyticus]MCY9622405.1 Gfo/Idh/MocA family oxidoreductase [Paenibacillus thiaminolyticus]
MTKKRVGIVGCGNIFPMHAKSVELNDLAELVAVCDLKEERAQKAAKQYNCDYYVDYKQMIDEAGLDVVHVCTPHHMHAPVVIYAAAKGKHVITEKPMSITVEDAEAMIEACRSNNVTFGVIFQNRYNPGSVLIKEALDSGKLGRVLGARCSVTWKRTDEYYSLSDWKGTWDKEGGGVIIDQAIHTLDLMRWFIGDDITAISAHIENRTHENIDVEDVADGVIQFTSGVMASFYAMNYHSYDAPVEIELHCEKGKAYIRAEKGSIFYDDGTEISRDSDRTNLIDYGEGVKSYWGISHIHQIGNFYDAVVNGASLHITGEEALKTQKMVAAIYQSGKTGQKVKF